MSFIIAGTAGHIDHGKTALVRVLTGIDTDRLEEEKRRGISIDIGFAHLDLTPEIRLGFVDVPGHERFVKNMLAGIAGIDLVLFVIAADESIKPQTREHFDICRLLGIRKGIVVLTKADLVEPDILELVRLETEEFVKGSFLENAPIVPVSCVTGSGLDDLRRRLIDIAGSIRAKDSSRHFRLPIDRSFSLRGFGTVVTGTLVSGSIRTDEDVEVHPAGRRLRVRGLQVHNKPVERAVAGQRTAVNLAGIDSTDLARGMVLTKPGLFQPTQRIDCEFELLPSAKPLKHRAPVHFHAGTAEVEAEVRLFNADSPLTPGSRGFVRFVLRKPVLLLPGDRFIVRMFSPVITIGGGRVLDIQPPARVRKGAPERLSILAEGSTADRIALLVSETEWGAGVAELIARTGLLRTEIESSAADPRLLLLGQPSDWLLDRSRHEALVKRLEKVLKDFHQQKPLMPGMPREELRTRELSGAPPFLLEEVLSGSKTMIAEGDIVRLATHRLALQQDESRALERIERAFLEAGLAVPPTEEVLACCGVEASRARSLLQILLKDRKLIRVGPELLYHSSAVEAVKKMLQQHKGERFNVALFKEWTGVSRKYAIPLLEHLDRKKVTRREGDNRVVL